MAYKFRGSDITVLRPQLEELTDLLEAKGHDVVTMIKDIQQWNPDCMSKAEAVRQGYRLMDTCDGALCVYQGLDPSEGRGFDTGYFVGADKPTIMAIPINLSIPFNEALFSENLANRVHNVPSIIRYETFKDIADLL
jgi:nucleoside 2-deoxyribosyltransferase